MMTSWTAHKSVVGHVARCWTELCIGLDDLVNGVDEISLGCNLAPRANGKNPGLSANAVYVRTYDQQPTVYGMLCEPERSPIYNVGWVRFDDSLNTKQNIFGDNIFYRCDDPNNLDSSESHQAHLTVLRYYNTQADIIQDSRNVSKLISSIWQKSDWAVFYVPANTV